METPAPMRSSSPIFSTRARQLHPAWLLRQDRVPPVRLSVLHQDRCRWEKASASSASAPRIPAPTVAPCPRCYAEPSAHRQFPLPPLLAASNHNPLPWQRARKERSEERCVGKECVSKCRSRGSPYH